MIDVHIDRDTHPTRERVIVAVDANGIETALATVLRPQDVRHVVSIVHIPHGTDYVSVGAAPYDAARHDRLDIGEVFPAPPSRDEELCFLANLPFPADDDSDDLEPIEILLDE